MLVHAARLDARNFALLLKGLPSFGQVDDETLFVLAEHATRRRYRSGEVLETHDGESEVVHVVIEGRVEVKMPDGTAMEIPQGRGVGFIELFARFSHGKAGIALEETTTLTMSTAVVLRALQRSERFLGMALLMTAGVLRRHLATAPAAPRGTRKAVPGDPGIDHQNLVDRIHGIRATPPFRLCPPAAAVSMASQIEVRDYRPDDLIWELGDPSDFYLRVVSGALILESDEGEQLVEPGHVVGLLDMIMDARRPQSARCLDAAVAYQVRRDTFLTTLQMHFSLARETLAMLTQPVLSTSSRVDTGKTLPPSFL